MSSPPSSEQLESDSSAAPKHGETATQSNSAQTNPENHGGNQGLGSRLISGIGRKRRLIATTGIAFSVVAVQLIQGMLLARLLGPEGRGQYATAVLYVQVFMFMGLLGGTEVLCRLATRLPNEVQKLRRLSRKTAFVTGLGTVGLISILSLLFAPRTNNLLPLSLLCGTSMVAHHFVLYALFVERGATNFRRYNLLNFISAVLFPAGLLLVWIFADVTLASACIVYVVAIYLAMGCTFIGNRPRAAAAKLHKKSDSKVNHADSEKGLDLTQEGAEEPVTGLTLPNVRGVLKQGRPYAAAMILVDLLERLDLLLMAWLAGFQDFGYFTAMIPTAYPLTVAPNTLGIFLFNKGARADGSLTPAAFKRSILLMIGFQLFSVTCYVLLIGLAVQIVYGPEFKSAVYFGYWLAPISAIKGMLLLLNSYLSGRGRPLAQSRSRIAALVITLVTVGIAYPWLGIFAVPFGSLCGASVCLVWLLATAFGEVRSQELQSESAKEL